jgi:hypothetical protein
MAEVLVVMGRSVSHPTPTLHQYDLQLFRTTGLGSRSGRLDRRMLRRFRQRVDHSGTSSSAEHRECSACGRGRGSIWRNAGWRHRGNGHAG